jgi:hypothetical protein
MISSNPTSKPELGSGKAKPLVPYSRQELLINYLEDDGDFENITIGEKIVIKDSWPLVKKSKQEIDILKMCKGKWGVAQFYGGYEVAEPEDPLAHASVGARFGDLPDHDELKRELQEEEEDINTPASVSLNRSETGTGSDTKTIRPHDSFSRQCMRLLFKSSGVPLTEAPNNAILLRSILDAVIGERTPSGLWRADIGFL